MLLFDFGKLEQYIITKIAADTETVLDKTVTGIFIHDEMSGIVPITNNKHRAS